MPVKAAGRAYDRLTAGWSVSDGARQSGGMSAARLHHFKPNVTHTVRCHSLPGTTPPLVKFIVRSSKMRYNLS